MRKRKAPASASVPEPGQGKRGKEGYLGYLLRQAANAYRTRQERVLHDLGITPPQFSVLTMISAYPGISNADIARLALLTPQTVSLIVANLKKADLVSRRPHAGHGRIHLLELTASGKTVLSKSRKRIHDLEKDLLINISEQEEQTIRHWLSDVAVSMTDNQHG